MRLLRLFTIVLTLALTFACILPDPTPADNALPTTQPPRLPVIEQQPTQLVETQRPRYCPENQGKLLFASDFFAYPETGANYDIYAANADGSQITRLTTSHLWEGYPVWSPDFCRIAYAADIPEESQTDIFIMNPNGTESIRLTSSPADDREPSWSPDGSQIVFTQSDGKLRDIYIVQADGSNLRQLTDHIEEDEKPEWSPVNDEIVFQSQRDGNFNIYVINSDGSGLTRLTNEPKQETHPTWSPDGTKIAFLSNRSGHSGVYIINRDGSGLVAVTTGGTGGPYPIIELSWSPDGKQIAFGSSGIPDPANPDSITGKAIGVVNVDGSNLRILAERGAHNCVQPEW